MPAGWVKFKLNADREKNVALSVLLMCFGSEKDSISDWSLFFESVCQGRCGWAELIICLHVGRFIPDLKSLVL